MNLPTAALSHWVSMLHDLSFGAPLWLWGLPALPVLAGLFVWAERRAAVRLVRLLREPRLRAQLTGAASAARRRWRFGLLLAGLAGLLVALAGPRLGYETLEVHRRGLDLVVIVDVSKSMLANDLAPSRLARAKLAVQDLLGQLTGDRVGLVAFAGDAFLRTPLTIDYDAVLDATSELDVDLIPTGGTDIGGAIDQSLEAFGRSATGNRAILLLTDGEPTVDTEQAAGVQAAKRAADAGARIFAVGFGTAEGALIPLANGRKGEFVRDGSGQLVRTRLNEAGLTEIARTGNGFYLRFTSGEATMRTIIQDGLSKLRAGEIDARADRRPIERYQWPLGAGLLFLALAALPGERRRYRAPAGVGGTTPGARAVPVRRATVAALALCAAFAAPARAEEAIPLDPPSGIGGGGPLALYRDQKYDEAFKAFSDLAKENPSQGSLQFDAGASAYMGKQYDEALEAFGKALTAPEPALRAKSHYNFGNSLFRRGEAQRDRATKIKDWRNAIQHYDATLAALQGRKVPDPGQTLASNTAYNRDLVQRRIDEELQQPPPPPPTPSPSPNKDDKKDQKKGDKSQPQQKDQQDKSQDKGDQQQPDAQSGQQQNKQPQPQQSQDKGGSSSSPQEGGQGNANQPQDGSSNQPPKPDSQQPQPSPGASPAAGGDPQQNQPQKGGSKPQDGQRNPSQGNQNAQNSPQDGTPDPDSVPNQNEPRQRGDFQAQSDPRKDAQAPAGQKGDDGEAAEQSGNPEEAGKMNAAQAKALLDSLKNEDARVMLNRVVNNRRHRDEAPVKDW